jgi:hypothetical protein
MYPYVAPHSPTCAAYRLSEIQILLITGEAMEKDERRVRTLT